MDTLITALAGLATASPLLFIFALIVLAVLGYPFLRRWMKENSTVADESEQIRKAGECIRAELNGMLDKEQLRVEALGISLDSARIEVGELHGENVALHSDMLRLRGEIRILFRTARGMRMAGHLRRPCRSRRAPPRHGSLHDDARPLHPQAGSRSARRGNRGILMMDIALFYALLPRRRDPTPGNGNRRRAAGGPGAGWVRVRRRAGAGSEAGDRDAVAEREPGESAVHRK